MRPIRQAPIVLMVLLATCLVATTERAQADPAPTGGRPTGPSWRSTVAPPADRPSSPLAEHAAAPQATRLPLAGYGAMLVDGVHHHVFVTGGAGDSALVVLTETGSIVTQFSDMAGADGIALDAKSKHAYVAECRLDAIEEIDASSLTRERSLRTGQSSCPSSLVRVGSRLWFQTSTGLASMTIKNGKVTNYTGADFPSLPLLAADPASDRMLFGATAGPGDTTAYGYAISRKGALSLGRSVFAPGGAADTRDIVVTADGADLLLACAGCHGLIALRTSDLQTDGDYLVVGATANAAAVSRDDLFVFAGIPNATTADDVFAFQSRSEGYFNGVTTKPADPWLADRGLSVSEDASELFAVAGPNQAAAPYDFVVFYHPTVAPSVVTLAATPGTIGLGQSTSLSGTLTFPNGGYAASRTVHLARTNPDASVTPLADMTTDGFGSFAENDQPPAIGSYTYTATFDGDPTHYGSNATAAVSVTVGGKIVFDSDRTGNYEIFVMNADGSGLRQLTNNAADDFNAEWSPDGTKIAFTSDRAGSYDVWTMNADGSGLTQITNDPHFDGDPSWSPDGTRIAFDSDRSGNMDIWTIDLPGGTLHRRSANAAVDEFPAWSPDGTRIAFDSNRTGDFEVFTMKTDGSSVTDVTNNPASDGGASWSPDSAKIAFGSNRTGDFEIWTDTLVNGTLARLTNAAGFDGDGSYSPDGSKIAFDSARTGTEQIWVMDASGANPVQDTNAGDINELPDWGGAS